MSARRRKAPIDDEVSRQLAGSEDAFDKTIVVLNLDKDDLKKRYSHLPKGWKRMHAANLLRARLHKGDQLRTREGVLNGIPPVQLESWVDQACDLLVEKLQEKSDQMPVQEIPPEIGVKFMANWPQPKSLDEDPPVEPKPSSKAKGGLRGAFQSFLAWWHKDLFRPPGKATRALGNYKERDKGEIVSVLFTCRLAQKSPLEFTYMLKPGALLIIYKDAKGEHWALPEEDFHPGRFVSEKDTDSKGFQIPRT
jgi:hypothetical protein